MLLRSLTLLFVMFIMACSPGKDGGIVESVAEFEEGVVATPIEKPDYTVVFGILFKADELTEWLTHYQPVARNQIVFLQNADDQGIGVIFEGNNAFGEAELRAGELLSSVFTGKTGVLGVPVITYYDVKFYKPMTSPGQYYLGLSFSTDNPGRWQVLAPALVARLNEKGLTPIGMGINREQPKDVYILLSVANYPEFRGNTKSHTEIEDFLEVLQLPDNTVLSYWQQPQ